MCPVCLRCAQQSAAFGFAQRTSASHAALINGASAHAFQLDEIQVTKVKPPTYFKLNEFTQPF
jgi:2-methylcitrate dehydratase PrpD